MFTPNDSEQVVDIFQGISFQWTHISECRRHSQSQSPQIHYQNFDQAYDMNDNPIADTGGYQLQQHAFQLTVLQKWVDRSLIRAYLRHVQATARDITRQDAQLKVRPNHSS